MARPPTCNCGRKDHRQQGQAQDDKDADEFAKLPVDEKRKKFNYKTKMTVDDLRSNTSPTESFCSCRSSTCNYCTCDSATLTPSSPGDGLDDSNTNSSSNVVDDGADDEATEVEGDEEDDDEDEEEEEEKVLSKSTKL